MSTGLARLAGLAGCTFRAELAEVAVAATARRPNARGAGHTGLTTAPAITPATGGTAQPADELRQLDAGLVLTSIGYRGKPIPDLPFDEQAARRSSVLGHRNRRAAPTGCWPGADVDWLPRQADSRPAVRRAGRARAQRWWTGPSEPGHGEPVPGAYVAGWIKRRPTGFIGTNKSCSMQTVQALVADFNDGRLTDPVATPTALDQLVQARQPQAIGCAGWRAIDAAEIARGSADGRVRNKFTDVAEMLAAATSAPKEPLRRRVLARLRDLGQPIVLTVPL